MSAAARRSAHSASQTSGQVYGIHWEKTTCTKQLVMEVKDFKRIKAGSGQYEETLLKQPILLEVHLPKDINSYSGGIHPRSHNCDPELGHGMLLLGHGRQEGLPYWLLRNSLGKRWGENGYLRISREMPEMSKYFKSTFVAKFKLNSFPEEDYVDLYDSIKFEPSVIRGSRATI